MNTEMNEIVKRINIRHAKEEIDIALEGIKEDISILLNLDAKGYVWFDGLSLSENDKSSIEEDLEVIDEEIYNIVKSLEEAIRNLENGYYRLKEEVDK